MVDKEGYLQECSRRYLAFKLYLNGERANMWFPRKLLRRILNTAEVGPVELLQNNNKQEYN